MYRAGISSIRNARRLTPRALELTIATKALRRSREVRWTSNTSAGPTVGWLGWSALMLLLGGATGFVAGYWICDEQADTGYSTKFGSADDFKAAIAELKTKLPSPSKVSTETDVLHQHGFSTNSYHPAVAHSVVVFPESTAEVVEIVKTANRYRMPIVPYSGGTSLEGHFSGVKGGCICVDMSNMNQMLELHEADGDVVVQAGMPWEELNQTLKDEGVPLFFPLDPGPGATIGGMVGTGCSGTNAVKYGTARSQWFVNLTMVLPNGEVIKTRSRARKSSAGWDLTKIFIGAEGTLGLVTEATLRLTPVVATSVAVAQFPDVKSAASAVQDILKSTAGDSIQCVELVDNHFMAATNKFGQSQRKYLEKDSLFLKIQGSASTIKENAKIVEAAVRRHGSLSFELAKDNEAATDLWQDRKNALWTTQAMIPGGRVWTTDVCVPVSRLPDLITETKGDLAEHGIKSTIVGHVGDGNFHGLLLFKDDEELHKVEEAVHRMVRRAIAMEGTCTGEHGVGLGKKEYLYEELGVGTVELMKKIKRTVDPLGIMNPGKLYPDLPSGSSKH